MSLVTRCLVSGCVALVTVLAGCSSTETTGDPRQGGLFGWSEEKAKQRQAEKRAHVSDAEANLSQETARGTELQHRQAATQRNLDAAVAQQKRATELLQIQRDKLIAKATHLEAISPTAAMASRARSLKLKVSTTAANDSLSPLERTERLYRMEGAIDDALERAQAR